MWWACVSAPTHSHTSHFTPYCSSAFSHTRLHPVSQGILSLVNGFCTYSPYLEYAFFQSLIDIFQSLLSIPFMWFNFIHPSYMSSSYTSQGSLPWQLERWKLKYNFCRSLEAEVHLLQRSLASYRLQLTKNYSHHRQ